MADSPSGQAIIGPMLEKAEAAPPTPTLPLASDYLAAKRFNDRGRLDRVWRGGRAVLGALALRRAVRGPDPADPDDRLLDWFWAFLHQPTWVVSAHLPGHDLPASGAPQLDLAACEMAMFMAEIREVLLPWITTVSGTLADSIIFEIDRRVLTPFGQGAEVWWHPSPNQPPRLQNNWTGVCAGSILAACESLAAQGHPRPKARARAIEALKFFFNVGFTPSGECDEGLDYWSYGVGVACLGLSRMPVDEVLATFDMERLRQIADYPRRAHLFGDVFHYGNDASAHVKPWHAIVPWLGAITGNEWLLRWAAQNTRGSRDSFGSVWRTLAVPDAALPDPETSGPLSSPEPATYLADQEVAILRSPTPKGMLLALLSGGHNGERHNHNDVGHFMVALGEEIVIPDLGNMHYTTDFFGPRRYTYLAASSRGHNCPLVNGQEQRTGAEARATVLAWDAQAGVFSIEASAAYPAEAGLSRWVRTLRRDGEGYVLIDEYETKGPGVEVGHVVWGIEPPSTATNDAVTMGNIALTLEPAAATHGVESHSSASLMLREFNDRQLHRLQWTYRTDDAGRLRVETRLRVVV